MGASLPGTGGSPAGWLVVSGPVTLAEAPQWRESLLAASAGGRDLRLDLDATGPWDLAGLQLLIAALATARREGSVVRFARVPRVLMAIAERAGVVELLAGSVESLAD